MAVFEENTLGVIFLIFSCSLLSYWEHKKEGSLFSPFNFLVWPYIIVVTIVNLFARYFGYFSISNESILFVIGCMVSFFWGGRIVAFFKQDKNQCFENETDFHFFDFYRPVFVFAGIVSIAASLIGFVSAINQVGWFFIGSSEFEDLYGKGLLAHISVLNRPAFIFLFADYFRTRKKYLIPILGLMFLSILVLQIKNHIITILLAAFLFSIQLNLIKINFKKLFGYSLSIYLIFNISYVIGFSRIGFANAYSLKVQLYLFNLFFAYVFGGPIAFSEIFSNPAYPLETYKEMFAVITNLLNTFQGNDSVVNVIIHKWVPISNLYRYFHTSNVFGLFGMVYIYIGAHGTLIYMFLLGIIHYSIFYLSCKTNAFVGWRLVNSFLLSFLTISFFGLFYNILLVYEASIFMICLPLLYELFNKLNRRIR